MRRLREIIIEVDGLTEAEILSWVEVGWVRPAVHHGEPGFSQADVARISLIADLRQRMGINDEAMPVILDLIDQIHGLREELRIVLGAIDDQPEPVRSRLREAVRLHHAMDSGKVGAHEGED